MEEIIKKICNNLNFINSSELEKKYEMLQTLFHKFGNLDFYHRSKDFENIVISIDNIDFKDVVYTYFLLYYDFRVEEMEERYLLLEKFFQNDKITNEDKQRIVFNTIFAKVALKKDPDSIINYVNKEENDSLLTYNSEDVFNILENIYMLTFYKGFMDMFMNIQNCYYDEKPKLDAYKLIDLFNQIDKSHKKVDSEVLESDKKYSDVNYLINYLYAAEYLKQQIALKDKEIKKELTRIRKNNNKIQEILDNITNRFNSIYKKELITSSDLINLKDLVHDDDIYNLVLEEAFKHNNEYIKTKKFGIEKKLELLFKKYNYNFSLLDEDKKKFFINSIDCEKIEVLLNILDSNNIRLTNYNLCKVLMNAKKDTIIRIKTLFNKGYIDNVFVNTHIDILYDDNIQAKMFSNISVLLNNGFNIEKIINSNCDIIFYDNTDISNNIDMLKNYKIDYKKDVNDYSYLIDSKCFSIIDSFIEEGLYSVIKIHPEYIRPKFLEIGKRIHINNLINSEIMKKNRVSSKLLFEKNYFLSDSLLDQYLCSHTDFFMDSSIKSLLKCENNRIDEDIYLNDVVIFLDKNYLSDDNYLFGDIIISRVKFLRNFSLIFNNSNYSSFDKIFNSLVNNSYLTYEEIDYLKNCVKNVTKSLTYIKK